MFKLYNHFWGGSIFLLHNNDKKVQQLSSKRSQPSK